MRLTVKNLFVERDTISRGSTEVLDLDDCFRSRDYWDDSVSMTVSVLQPSSMVSSVESAPEWQPLSTRAERRVPEHRCPHTLSPFFVALKDERICHTAHVCRRQPGRSVGECDISRGSADASDGCLAVEIAVKNLFGECDISRGSAEASDDCLRRRLVVVVVVVGVPVAT